MGGPFWLAPIHDRNFVEQILQMLEQNSTNSKTNAPKFGTIQRMVGMLTVVAEELEDCPFYYTQDRLFSMIKVGSGKMTTFRSALLNAGYHVSLSHACKVALKTDAPNDFIWDMMRAWEKLNPIKRDKLPKDSIALKILNKESVFTDKVISFDMHPEANPASRMANLRRFQMNPAPNWGPKMKAHTSQTEIDQKRKRNQGKTANKRKKEEDDNSLKHSETNSNST